MSVDKITKYLWVIDTLMTHGTLRRSDISALWQKSHLSNGAPLPHRSFFTMRREIEEIFGIDIKVNKAYEYYVEKEEDSNARAFRSWMLDSYAARSAMGDTGAIADRIIVDEVPSARRFLRQATEAVRSHTLITFTYSSYTRSKPNRDIRFAPFFLRLYHQRWYIIGRRLSDGEIRTYALDRITELTNTETRFDMPADMDPKDYFEHIIGITSSQSEPQTVKIRVNHHLAKYLRDLPLHHSQKEELFSSCSIFTLRLRLTPDLVREILTLGPDATVLEPKTLRLMVVNSLQDTLKNYEEQ